MKSCWQYWGAPAIPLLGYSVMRFRKQRGLYRSLQELKVVLKPLSKSDVTYLNPIQTHLFKWMQPMHLIELIDKLPFTTFNICLLIRLQVSEVQQVWLADIASDAGKLAQLRVW